MGPTLDDALRMLREATEQAPLIRVELDEEYLRYIAAVEALPQNQSGADKTWVERSIESSNRHFAAAIRKG